MGCVYQFFILKQKRKNCFIGLEKAYKRVDREALWQVLSGIKGMYVDSLECQSKSG